MKNRCIFGGGDSDGLIGIATILNVVDDAFFSFTTPHSLPDTISEHVIAPGGEIYVVGLAVDVTRVAYLKEVMEIKSSFESFFFDYHNLPENVFANNLPFTKVYIDEKVSGCENAYRNFQSTLNVIFPAIASINSGFQDTAMIHTARETYGGRLDENATILKFGLAWKMGDNRFKWKLVNDFRDGKYPDTIIELKRRYGLGLKKFDKLKEVADDRKKDLSHLCYGYFPDLRVGFTDMLAEYLAESNGKKAGLCVLQITKPSQKINVICNDEATNIGQVVYSVALECEGIGWGSKSSAGAKISSGNTREFIESLNQRLSEY